MAQSSSPPTYAAVVEQSSVAPPPGKVAGFSLPLAFLDLNWMYAFPVHRLIFYQHPVSRTHFKDTIIPHLKTSFSIALQYYPLLAAKLAVPSDYSTPPEILYVEGDGVPLVFAVSDDNSGRFDGLSSNHARNCNEFYPLNPTLPSVRSGMFAVKVTLFPEAGICVGIANHHVVGDRSSIFGFMKAWTALSLLGHKSSSLSLSDEYLPFLDRSVIGDPKGLKALEWNQMKHIPIDEDGDGVPLPDVTSKARATFIVSQNNIQKLKTHVISRRRSKVARQPSSFVVTCAYMWTCLLRSQCFASSINRDEDDDTVYFLCAADCRARFDTPLPANYFGNCLVPCIASAKAGQLAAEGGLAAAAEAIGEAIHRQLRGEEGVLGGAENWMSFFGTVSSERILGVAGSPRLDYYRLDFGWGKPKKIETTSIDYSGTIYVGCAKESLDIEVGVSVPVPKMHLLKTLFDEGLQALSL
ncbi:PREDICTED: malonyl-coenzyme:anthocyanin 5-O-glucoside-6'''-O-malonyltransferase-like [Ipomoea nil]|uniref:malonyl-coenzyme:anthocyanin 5-O-glucoside-6'''-O-malonyltransferase-like n=1 Tax=Ipomoea nil TaxID=35883 RepID=UPI000900FCBB|nr:PREDICTED: malonyl-coenzyme:anthocyanin 5-O-glucoside-6'''-O-malonyltransferase-like [Ipomoea nil]